jgi:hypothetical protein
LQRIGRRILKVPEYKKSDDPDQLAKLVTLDKWKGEGPSGGAGPCMM